MATSTQWQLAREAAERYQRILVPTILGPAAQALVEWAGLQPGEIVLDVGCGTGAATRGAAEKVGPTGHVIGIDVNREMLAVAKALPAIAGAEIEWAEHSAEQLPLADQTVDAVLCSQTLQFLADRRRAVAEMRRVLKRDGRVALSLWCNLEQNPYFQALVEAITRHIGHETAVGLAAAFRLSNANEIEALLVDTGFKHIERTSRQLDLELPPLSDFVPRHISATPMVTGFNAASQHVQQAVIQDIAEQFAGRATATGVLVEFRSHLVQARP